jgi:adenylate cyclase
MEGAVLFADVAGSTALYEVLGDERAFALVGKLPGRDVACTAPNSGRPRGQDHRRRRDVGVPQRHDAAAAAVWRCRSGRPPGPASAACAGRARGFSLRAVVRRDGDVFGDTVNLASRLCDLASRGQIVTDRDTARCLAAI